MASNALGNNAGRLYSFGAQPVLIDCNFVVDPANGNGLGVRNLKGQGVENVFMHTTATPGKGANGYLNPNPASGYALVQLSSNYNRYLGGFSGFVSPLTGSAIDINATALTIGDPYVITSVGVGPEGSATISPVADSSGSLASTYFTLYDSYGNVFCIWFYVTGVGGAAPNLGPQTVFNKPGLQYVQQTIAENASADAITTALSATINLLPSGVTGVYSFTTSGGGTATLTVTSTLNAPLAGVPQDGNQVIAASNSQPVPIFFNLSPAGSATAASVWTDGFGNLYTVSTTLSSGTLLKTSGVQDPANPSGTLTYVSGPGATSPLNYTSAVAGFATGFTFALVNYNTNLACWRGVGLPPGVNPNVGASFVATATGVSTGGGSSGQVFAPGVSGITNVEVIGDPNQSFAPVATGYSSNVGAWILVQFLASGSVTAPTSQSVCGMAFYVDNRFSPSNVGY
jgi:hypothetical protein